MGKYNLPSIHAERTMKILIPFLLATVACVLCGLGGDIFVAAVDSYNNGGSCYDCQYAPGGQDNNYSGFYRCALEQEDDALYVNKWSCTSERCFIRKDPNGQVFRGCADQWNLPWGIDTTSNCSRQGHSGSIWWFCDGHLCNDGFLHDEKRCGSIAVDSPKQESDKIHPYYNDLRELRVAKHEARAQPYVYEKDAYILRTTLPPSSSQWSMPMSVPREEDNIDSQPEYVVEEETVHGVGFYNHFPDLEENPALMPQALYQNDPRDMLGDANIVHEGTLDDISKNTAQVGINPIKRPLMMYDYEGQQEVVQPPMHTPGGQVYTKSFQQPQVNRPSGVHHQQNQQLNINEQTRIKRQFEDRQNYGKLRGQEMRHQLIITDDINDDDDKDDGDLQRSKEVGIDSSKSKIYDHGGINAETDQPHIHVQQGISLRRTIKHPSSARRPISHTTEPFWMWWWHSGAYQRMTPQQAYNDYLVKNANSIEQANRVVLGGVNDRRRNFKRKSHNKLKLIHTHLNRQSQRSQNNPNYRQFDYSPIRSNRYFSRISKRLRQIPYRIKLGHQFISKPPESSHIMNLQENVSKSQFEQPIHSVKTIAPRDYKSFKPPHAHGIVEPLGQGAGTLESKTNSDVTKQNETKQDEAVERVLSKQSFYDYYDNFKFTAKQDHDKDQEASREEYNPCGMTCSGKNGTLHKDPLRHNRFIQCGPGSRYGNPCKCCQPFYHVCPEGTSFDSMHKVCSQAGSSTIEETRYKSLDLEY